MKTLIEKEIRLLLPAFAAALALAVLPVWLLPPDPGNGGGATSWLYLLGAALLPLCSFGREDGLKTFPFVLAQPLERSRIWWIKIAVLGMSAALVFGAWRLSATVDSAFQAKRVIDTEAATNYAAFFQPKRSMLAEAIAFYGLIAAVFVASGLWLTLLLRQVVAAFWLSFLIPAALAGFIKVVGGTDTAVFAAFGLYAVAGFLAARWQFLHLQDAAWTGGVISFGGRSSAAGRSSTRERRPWAALIWKELQLQQFTLVGMGCLLVLHLGAVALRTAGAHTFGKSTLLLLDAVGGLWLIVPLVAGSQTVAEERQLGAPAGLLCLPAPRKIQFCVKIIFVFVIGAMLSVALLCAVEWLGNTMDPERKTIEGGFVVQGMLLLSFVFLVIALISFYASTLTRGLVPALAAASFLLILTWVSQDIFHVHPPTAYGVAFQQGIPPDLIGWPVMVATLLWLSYRNFGNATESGNLWRRNAFALAMVLIAIFGLTIISSVFQTAYFYR